MIKVWKEGSDLQLPTEEAIGFKRSCKLLHITSHDNPAQSSTPNCTMQPLEDRRQPASQTLCTACIDNARASCNITVPDPDLEIRRGRSPKTFFRPFGARASRAPPLDPPLPLTRLVPFSPCWRRNLIPVCSVCRYPCFGPQGINELPEMRSEFPFTWSANRQWKF